MSEFKQQLWSMDMLPKDILIEKIKRLEQDLKEIKEIAELACEKSICDENHCDYCSDGRIIKICEVIDE